MIHHILSAAVAAALLLSVSNAQETQGEATGTRTERPQQKPRRDVGSQPGGETRPMRNGDEPLTPRERAKRYLDAHPEVRKQLMAKADTDGDGKLSESERKTMMELVEAKMKALREERQEQAEEKREERQEERKEKCEEQAEKMRKRADRNGDGTVDETEQQRAKEVRSEVREKRQERADRNDDGRVGPRERERAQEVRENRQENEGERPRADKKKRQEPRPAPAGDGS